MTREVKHFLVWLYERDDYRDTEIWLWRHTVFRLYGLKVWTRRERKVYLPVWAWGCAKFHGLPYEFYSEMGGARVSYDWLTGDVTERAVA